MEQVELVNSIISKMSVPDLQQVANHVYKTAQQRIHELEAEALNEDLQRALNLRAN